MHAALENLTLHASDDSVARCDRAVEPLGHALPQLRGRQLEVGPGFPLYSVFRDEGPPSLNLLREATPRATRFVVCDRVNEVPLALFDVHKRAPNVMPSVTVGPIVSQTLRALEAADARSKAGAVVAQVEFPEVGAAALWAKSGFEDVFWFVDAKPFRALDADEFFGEIRKRLTLGPESTSR